MKVRIKFAKLGNIKFIGHLDIMRYFQKAIKRAELDIAYSAGFNPHQKMSFASPLGVGITSSGEYMDIELNSVTSSRDIKERLDAQMVAGIEVISVKGLSDDSKNAMSIVAGASYEIKISEEYKSLIDISKIEEFYNLPEIMAIKKTKKSEKELDIKPMIYSLSSDNNSISMFLSTGSVSNLKPELVLEAYFNYLGLEMNEFSYQIKRLEIFANGDENMGFISLENLGHNIEN